MKKSIKKSLVLPLNEIGIYKDSDGNIYESKIFGLIVKEDEEGYFILRPISETDLEEGYIDLIEKNGFLKLKK